MLADQCFGLPRGKIAQTLVRGSDRFAVRAVVDRTLAGRDAGEVLDGVRREIPIVGGVPEALGRVPDAAVAVVGDDTPGGTLTPELRTLLVQCARAGLDLVSGLHDHVCDDTEIAALARAAGATITDIRRTSPTRELRFWDGTVYSVRATRIAVLGTDSSADRRTTARLLGAELNARGVRTEMIYTGRTGWMQGGRYGIVYDALIADFTAGELEGAIMACANDIDPDVMLIDGQGSFRNPSGPCGTGVLLSAAVSGVILAHAPQRNRFPGFAHLGWCQPPSLASEITLIGHYGVPVLAVALDLTGLERTDADLVISQCRAQLDGTPVLDLGSGGTGELAGIVADRLG